ncbi:MAG: tetratricopeptide repeat protein [Candidatus Riflebacteria bacterium]|nr:tetratricopeptide repeat protein [Candidatus Riflebacteria bacterium]
MRAEAYFFAHQVIPSILWNGDSMLGILANPVNTEYLSELWEMMRGDPRFGNYVRDLASRLAESQDPDDDLLDEIFSLPPDWREPIDQRGMTWSAHWLGDAHLAYLLRFPVPKYATEAHFGIIVSSPKIRYFTIELGEDDRQQQIAFFCEWTSEMHMNISEIEATPEKALTAVCERLGIPVTVDPPLRRQQDGMSRHQVFDSTLPESLAGADLEKVTAWEKQAEEASENGDHAKALELIRQINQLWLKALGPENTYATNTFRGLVRALLSAGRQEEAMEVAEKWWKICRRYRFPGHAETISAISSVARVLKAMGSSDAAADLLAYNLQYARLTRGANSASARSAALAMELAESDSGTPHAAEMISGKTGSEEVESIGSGLSETPGDGETDNAKAGWSKFVDTIIRMGVGLAWLVILFSAVSGNREGFSLGIYCLIGIVAIIVLKKLMNR